MRRRVASTLVYPLMLGAVLQGPVTFVATVHAQVTSLPINKHSSGKVKNVGESLAAGSDCLRNGASAGVGDSSCEPKAKDNFTNILLILTDDQRSDTLDDMPAVQSLAAEGIRFTQSFVPTALCGPSRASLLTGQYAHHTGVLTNSPPHGGAPMFDASHTIATVLHDAGYATGYFGKYMNAYDQLSPAIPPGWDAWQALVGDGDLYFNYRLNEDGIERDHGAAAEEYSTDLLRDRAAAFIQAHASGPWFAVYAPFAPHGNAVPAPRHSGHYEGIAPWRPPNYAEADLTDKPPYWVRWRSVWSSFYVDYNDKLRRRQLETLLAVDEAVAVLMSTLRVMDISDRTVVIYTSDNGLTWGEHWMSGKKRCGYEECGRVPLVIRDPRIRPRTEKRRLVLGIDIAPTIAALAGVSLAGADGMSLLPLLQGVRGGRYWRRDFLTEGWNFDDPAATKDPPSYVGIRNERRKYLRTEGVSGNVLEELYDLRRDRFERDGTIRSTTAARHHAENMRERLLEYRASGRFR